VNLVAFNSQPVPDDDTCEYYGNQLYACGNYNNGNLFKRKLCVPRGSLRELIVIEAHGGALGGHLGIKKIIEILKERLLA